MTTRSVPEDVWMAAQHVIQEGNWLDYEVRAMASYIVHLTEQPDKWCSHCKTSSHSDQECGCTRSEEDCAALLATLDAKDQSRFDLPFGNGVLTVLNGTGERYTIHVYAAPQEDCAAQQNQRADSGATMYQGTLDSVSAATAPDRPYSGPPPRSVAASAQKCNKSSECRAQQPAQSGSLPTLSEVLTHTRSCPQLTSNADDPCTCGLLYRQREQTAMNIAAAWRKRAEEAELALRRTDAADELLREALGELRWCSGSPDFNEGGQARIGWLKGPVPLMDRISAYLKGKQP